MDQTPEHLNEQRLKQTMDAIGRKTCHRASTIANFGCLLLLLLVGVFISTGCSLAATSGERAFEKLPGSFQQLVDDGLMPGAVTMVADRGTVVHRCVVGYMDVSAKKPMEKDCIFRLYSMSKPITSVGIMILVDEGKLSLDDPAEKFIPSFKGMRVYVSGGLEDMEMEPVRRPITIKDLLTHSSGITYHFTGDTPVHQYYRKYGVKRNTPVGSLPTDAPAATSLFELVARIARAPLLHQPGERFSYSYSTTVLGYIIERVSGKRLDTFLEERIFQPLEMNDTGFFITGERLGRFVTNYLMTDKGLQEIENSENTDYRDESRLLDGGGAIAGTADDYMHFAMMLANEGEWHGVRILRPETVRDMFKARIPLFDGGGEGGPEFGLGFAIGDAQTETAESEMIIPAGFYGWAGSGNTFFWVDPTHHTAVVFMTQVITPPGFAEASATFRHIVFNALKAFKGTQ